MKNGIWFVDGVPAICTAPTCWPTSAMISASAAKEPNRNDAAARSRERMPATPEGERELLVGQIPHVVLMEQVRPARIRVGIAQGLLGHAGHDRVNGRHDRPVAESGDGAGDVAEDGHGL